MDRLLQSHRMRKAPLREPEHMSSGFIPLCGYTVTPIEARPPRRTGPAADSPSLLDIWVARALQRKALSALADGNEHLLKDIGISRDAALREAAKWFWQK